MTLTALASSSAGNAYLLDDGQSKLLIECGLSYRKLQTLLGFGTTSLCGCLLSHEHKDHARAYLDLLKNGTPVFASAGTAAALDCDTLCVVASGQEISIGSFDIKPFPVFHDAEEPLGFLIRSRADGEKLLFATDTVNLAYRVPGLHLLALECNYAEDILARATRMPDKVKARIRNSHMELSRTCTYLKALDLSVCRRIYLLHLSDACSNEWRFAQAAQAAADGVTVEICPKEIKKN